MIAPWISLLGGEGWGQLTLAHTMGMHVIFPFPFFESQLLNLVFYFICRSDYGSIMMSTGTIDILLVCRLQQTLLRSKHTLFRSRVLQNKLPGLCNRHMKISSTSCDYTWVIMVTAFTNILCPRKETRTELIHDFEDWETYKIWWHWLSQISCTLRKEVTAAQAV